MYLHEFLELGAQILGDFYLGCNSSISGVFCDRTHLRGSRERVPTAVFIVSKIVLKFFYYSIEMVVGIRPEMLRKYKRHRK